MITICMTYFKSLTLSNLAAALWSIRRQDLSLVDMIVIVDNDTEDSAESIAEMVNAFKVWPVPVKLVSHKHSDANKTHAWSTNEAVSHATAPWVLFTRADYLLDFDIVTKFHNEACGNRFVTSNGSHLQVTVDEVETTQWRQVGPASLGGSVFDYTIVDAGVWMARRDTVRAIQMHEGLTAWGHAQTEFQYRLYRAGVEFVRIPEVLFVHPFHGGPRDIDLAHKQLSAVGVDLKTMWSRYEGVNPYAAL